MELNLKNFVLLFALVAFTLLLRDNQVSPGGFLEKQISRILQQQNQKLADKLCSGIDPYNSITPQQRDLASQFRTSLSKLRKENKLEVFINSDYKRDDFAKEYVVPAVAFGIPWIILFGISILACLSCSCNWCCVYCCPDKCGCAKSPKLTRMVNCYVLMSVVFMACFGGAGIAGIITTNNVSSGGQSSICSGAILMDKLVDGSQENKFIGLLPAIAQINATLANLQTTIQNLQPTGNTFTDMDAKLALAIARLEVMHNGNQNSAVRRPDPQIGGTYKPQYVQNLGPTTNQSTYTGAIRTEMETKQSLVKNASVDIDAAIVQMKANPTLFLQIQKAQEEATNSSTSVNKFREKFAEFGDDSQKGVDHVSRSLRGLFAAIVLISGVAISSIFLVCCRCKFFNKCIHLSWCLTILLVILGWAISAFLFPGTLILVDVCQVFDKALQNATFFNRTTDKFMVGDDANIKKAKDTLYRCIHGDGDFADQIGLRSSLAVFETMFSALDNTTQYTQGATQNIPDSLVIPPQQQLLTSTGNGLTPDGPESVQDLVTLNSYTGSGNQCTQMKDSWVMNSANCSTIAGTVFTASSAANFNVPNPTCIGYDAWTTQDITQRYTSTAFPPGSCSAVGSNQQASYLQSFVGGFVTNRNQLKTVTNSLQSNLADVSSANSNFMTALKQVTAPFTTIKNTAQALYNALWDPSAGVLTNSNCKFIKGSLSNFQDNICTGFTSGMFETSIVMLIASFMGLIGALMLFCLAKNFLNKFGEDYQEKDERAKRI